MFYLSCVCLYEGPLQKYSASLAVRLLYKAASRASSSNSPQPGCVGTWPLTSTEFRVCETCLKDTLNVFWGMFKWEETSWLLFGDKHRWWQSSCANVELCEGIFLITSSVGCCTCLVPFNKEVKQCWNCGLRSLVSTDAACSRCPQRNRMGTATLSGEVGSWKCVRKFRTKRWMFNSQLHHNHRCKLNNWLLKE